MTADPDHRCVSTKPTWSSQTAEHRGRGRRRAHPGRSRRRDPAVVDARRPRRPHAGRRPGPPVLAVQLARRTDGAWRIGSPAHPGQPRAGRPFVHEHPDRGRHRARPRAAQPLPAGRPPRYLFIAGGIGITPMLPMIAQAEAAGADWRLLYGGRHRASMAFLPELAQYGDRVTVVPQDEARLPRPRRRAGHPQTGHPGLLLRPRGAARPRWRQVRDLAVGRLHLERFSAKPQATPSCRRELRAGPAADRRHASRCRRTRVVFDVRHRGRRQRPRLLPRRASAAPARQMSSRATSTTATPSSTRRSGPPTSSMMICVSRCRSGRLTLDL